MERYKGISGEGNRVQPLISEISRVFYFILSEVEGLFYETVSSNRNFNTVILLF